MRWATRLTSLLAALAASVACGPSFQVVYEGDSRFEHCYALDENPNVLMQEKGACWSDWLTRYTYGQTRDRVEFAAVRYRAIQRAGSVPTDEAVMGAAPGESSKRVTLAPTNAFASPPRTMDEEHPASSAPDAAAPTLPPLAPETLAPAPVVVGPAPVPPGSACLDRCSATWHQCQGCASPPCTACDRTYARCAKACLP